ncbi:glycosyltransferase family 4 protein [Pontibacter toksunensis]|uniref:Glycosyltransferase family 4 protein n=1 Tax=Pontibacter toksunensis TaxID=1332631 RepID=A0ABW6BST7_9BACT
MHSKPSVLFLLNDFNLGGANKLLLGFAEWLHINKSLDLIFGSMTDGIMRNEFNKIGYTRLFNFKKLSLYNRFSKKLAPADLPQNQLSEADISFLEQRNISLIYANTIHNEKLSNAIRKEIEVPLIVHAHEQPYIMRLFYSAALQEHLSGANAIIIVSKTSGAGLIEIFNMDSAKLHQVYPAIKLPGQASSLIAKDQRRKELDVPSDAFVVLGMGNPHWIKGVDLFILTAQKVINKNASVHFIWVGGTDNNEYLNDQKKDVQLMGLTENIHFVSSVMHPEEYFNIADVFFLSSRVDTFPLVTLEASQFSLPVICFENAGGITEIIDEYCGSVIEYNNLESASDAILAYCNNLDTVKEKGKSFQFKVSQSFIHENMCLQLGNILDSKISIT